MLVMIPLGAIAAGLVHLVIGVRSRGINTARCTTVRVHPVILHNDDYMGDSGCGTLRPM